MDLKFPQVILFKQLNQQHMVKYIHFPNYSEPLALKPHQDWTDDYLRRLVVGGLLILPLVAMAKAEPAQHSGSRCSLSILCQMLL